MMCLHPKRIVIVGSAGIGKTTLAEHIKDKLHIRFIPEQARVICKTLGYKSIYEIKDPNYFRVLVLKKQIKLEEKLKNFLTDRGTIDCWIHWLRWSAGRAMSHETENYFNTAYGQALKYSHIIYIPYSLGSSIKSNDGFRWNNEEYQNQIDRLFKQTLLEWELMNKTYIVKSKILKDRIKEVLGYLTLS